MNARDLKTPVQIFASWYNKRNTTSAKAFIKSNSYLYNQVIVPALMDVQQQEFELARLNEQKRMSCVGCIATNKDLLFDEVQRLLRTPNPWQALKDLEEREKREYEAIKQQRLELFNTLRAERDVKRNRK